MPENQFPNYEGFCFQVSDFDNKVKISELGKPKQESCAKNRAGFSRVDDSKMNDALKVILNRYERAIPDIVAFLQLGSKYDKAVALKKLVFLDRQFKDCESLAETQKDTKLQIQYIRSQINEKIKEYNLTSPTQPEGQKIDHRFVN